MRRVAAAALACSLAVGLTGCMFGSSGSGGQVSTAASTEQLEQQRLDVRAAATELIRGAESALSGRRYNPSGSYRGCQSGGLEHYKNFRYTFGARIDAAPAAAPRPYLDAVRPALEAAGFVVTEDPDASAPGLVGLVGVKGELSAVVSELPEQGDYVLLDVTGPCVDVPKADSDDWLRFSDDEPLAQ